MNIKATKKEREEDARVAAVTRNVAEQFLTTSLHGTLLEVMLQMWVKANGYQIDGLRVSFPEGNDVPYGQDFKQDRGVPANVEFVIDSAGFASGRVKLVAEGHGVEGNYGDGAIYVAAQYVVAALVLRHE